MIMINCMENILIIVVSGYINKKIDGCSFELMCTPVALKSFLVYIINTLSSFEMSSWSRNKCVYTDTHKNCCAGIMVVNSDE